VNWQAVTATVAVVAVLIAGLTLYLNWWRGRHRFGADLGQASASVLTNDGMVVHDVARVIVWTSGRPLGVEDIALDWVGPGPEPRSWGWYPFRVLPTPADPGALMGADPMQAMGVRGTLADGEPRTWSFVIHTPDVEAAARRVTLRAVIRVTGRKRPLRSNEASIQPRFTPAGPGAQRRPLGGA
jgi:hypothetical protein